MNKELETVRAEYRMALDAAKEAIERENSLRIQMRDVEVLRRSTEQSLKAAWDKLIDTMDIETPDVIHMLALNTIQKGGQ